MVVTYALGGGVSGATRGAGVHIFAAAGKSAVMSIRSSTGVTGAGASVVAQEASAVQQSGRAGISHWSFGEPVVLGEI